MMPFLADDAAALNAASRLRRFVGLLLYLPLHLIQSLWWLARFFAGVVAMVVVLIIAGNLAFHSPRGMPYRALDPTSDICRSDGGWDIFARPAPDETGQPGIANDEWWAIDHGGKQWRGKLACSIQHHVLPGYRAPDGTQKTIGYDLAFLEFQEDGKPYTLRQLCTDAANASCTDEGYGQVRHEADGQLEAVLDRLKQGGPYYVMVFVHGWRHDASIGDANVAEFRDYAAHAARFLEDRAGSDPKAPHPRVFAVYVGWRGARTDETDLRHNFGQLGAWIGTFSSTLTLFDRKPVSEAVAPQVLAALREIERVLGIRQPLATPLDLPQEVPNKMIVFGHSLGGNMLATALEADLVKKVDRHDPGSYMLPVLGDLVILINPASEATKWTAIQRAVWDRIAVSLSERRPVADYIASHLFFRPEQRPIVVSVTAALDWPPGGRREIDCAGSQFGGGALSASRRLAEKGVQYDWATYDLFPAFKGDLRPLADTLDRIGSGRDPHDPCDTMPLPWSRWLTAAPLAALGAMLRVVPFMQTDPEQTRTIGQLDPPRGPGRFPIYSGRPIGTTHELRGWDKDADPMAREWSAPNDDETPREIPVDYGAIVGPLASCPRSDGWLDLARHARLAADANGHAVGWSSRDAGTAAPALIFEHGFTDAGLPAITRASDPFWNMRAFDTALARHDGYMLSSFICAMNQLVMDKPTVFAAPPPSPAAAATPAALTTPATP